VFRLPKYAHLLNPAVHLVLIAWAYVVLMMALVEAFAPNGTVLGALFTVLLYGVLPLWIVLYLLGTPARWRARKRRESVDEPSGPDPDGGGQPPGGAVAAE
jgi:hypothetical protein